MGSDNFINTRLIEEKDSEFWEFPDIPANRNELAVKIFDKLFESMFKKNFTSIRVKNKQNYYLRNSDYANLFYGFHGCWWDGPLAAFICRKLYNCNFYMMIKDLYRFPFLSKIGGFSIEKNSLYGKLKSINYAVKLLQNPKNSVWIFPQGRLYPLDYRPIKFESGVSHICSRLKGVNLIPIAYKYTFIQKAKPEVFVEIGRPIIVNGQINEKKEFTKKIEEEFTMLLDKQRSEILMEKFKEYKYIVFNDFNWLYFIEKNFKPLIRKRY